MRTTRWVKLIQGQKRCDAILVVARYLRALPFYPQSGKDMRRGHSRVRVSFQPAQYPVRVLRSLHFDFYAHPGMYAALKEMLSLRKSCELKLAALQDSGSGNLHSRKASVAFWHGILVRGIQSGYKTTSVLCDFGEGMRFAALIHHIQDRVFVDLKRVRLEVPLGVRASTLCCGK